MSLFHRILICFFKDQYIGYRLEMSWLCFLFNALCADPDNPFSLAILKLSY